MKPVFIHCEFLFPQAGKHQEYEQKLLQELYKLNPNFLQLSTGTVDKNKNKVTALQRYDA